jgi:hypothetical protein
LTESASSAGRSDRLSGGLRKPGSQVGGEKVGGSEEQILVDIERRLLFADKEKGGENAG